LSFGNIGGFLVIKLVKPTKVFSRPPYHAFLRQFLPSQAEPNRGLSLIFHSELFHAVEQINEADDLLRKNSASDLASNRATALLLSAIARVLVVEAAAQHDMSTRLSVFKHGT
jgi:hypothetical protein